MAKAARVSLIQAVKFAFVLSFCVVGTYHIIRIIVRDFRADWKSDLLLAGTIWLWYGAVHFWVALVAEIVKLRRERR